MKDNKYDMIDILHTAIYNVYILMKYILLPELVVLVGVQVGVSAPVRVPSEVAEPDVVSEVVEDKGEAGAALRHPAGRAAEEAVCR